MLIIMIRVILIYGVIVFGLRVMGKRQIGELQPSELVITILISNIATLPIEDTNVPIIAGIVPVLTLVTFEVLLSTVTLRYKSIRKIISGNPRIVIKDGKIDQKELKNLRFSIDDLMAQLREKDVFDIRDVGYAIVETTGSLSIYKKYEARNVDAKMIGLSSKQDDGMPPVVVIGDGVLIDQSLQECNIKKSWVEKILTERDLQTKDIFLMTCDRHSNYFIVIKEKK